MAPIRVGFIGLSTKPAWANRTHFVYLTASPHYQIVALLNSSVSSAKAAIAHYELPSTTKAYGSPEDLAKDPDVDLIVCSVNVGEHYKLVKPMLEAGKGAVVEWPLASSLSEAEELLKIAEEKRVKHAVMLQGRFNPTLVKIKEMIKSGKIGRVLNSNATAFCGMLENNGVTSKTSLWTLKKEVGGNNVTILFMHLIDGILSVLGELDTFDALLSIQRPVMKFMEGGTFNRTTHDQVMVHGTLESGGVLSVHLAAEKRREVGYRWNIQGETGEFEIVAPGPFPQVSPPIEATYYDANGKAEVITVSEKDEATKILPANAPKPAENVARFYEAFRKGESDKYATFNHAVMRQRWVEAMYNGEHSYK